MRRCLPRWPRRRPTTFAAHGRAVFVMKVLGGQTTADDRERGGCGRRGDRGGHPARMDRGRARPRLPPACGAPAHACAGCSRRRARPFSCCSSRAGLVMQSALQVFFIAMAVYGWRAAGTPRRSGAGAALAGDASRRRHRRYRARDAGDGWLSPRRRRRRSLRRCGRRLGCVLRPGSSRARCWRTGCTGSCSILWLPDSTGRRAYSRPRCSLSCTRPIAVQGIPGLAREHRRRSPCRPRCSLSMAAEADEVRVRALLRGSGDGREIATAPFWPIRAACPTAWHVAEARERLFVRFAHGEDDAWAPTGRGRGGAARHRESRWPRARTALTVPAAGCSY